MINVPQNQIHATNDVFKFLFYQQLESTAKSIIDQQTLQGFREGLSNLPLSLFTYEIQDSLYIVLTVGSECFYFVLSCITAFQQSKLQTNPWMRCLTGDQEVAGSTPAEVSNILSWRLIMKYFLRTFSPFR